MFPDQQSTEAPETSNENTQWLVLDELVSHDLLESSPPGSPRPYLKSESNEPAAEAGRSQPLPSSPSSRRSVKRRKSTTSAACTRC